MIAGLEFAYGEQKSCYANDWATLAGRPSP
jgi:hypothetical protein